MSRLMESLDRLVEGWERYGLDPKRLLPGLGADDVQERIRRASGLEPTNEVVEWFGFADGHNRELFQGGRVDHEFGLVPPLRMASLAFGEDSWLLFEQYQQDAALEHNLEPAEAAALPAFTDREIGYFPDTSYFPVASSNSPTSLAVRLAAGLFPGPPVGSAVAVCSYGEVWISVVWPSLADFVNEAAWLHLTDQVTRFEPGTNLWAYDGPTRLLGSANEQLARPLPEVQAFFGDTTGS